MAWEDRGTPEYDAYVHAVATAHTRMARDARRTHQEEWDRRSNWQAKEADRCFAEADYWNEEVANAD